MNPKVLVTGAGALIGQGVIKSLRMAAAPYHVVAVDPDPRAVGLYWADTSYLVPEVADPGYLPAVERILDRERPDAVLVGTDVELGVFALHRARLEAAYRTRVLVSSPEVVRIADDKWLTCQFLADQGLPHPRSALPGDVETLLRACDFPLVVKPRSGARSRGVEVVRDRRALDAAMARVADPVVQECVATDQDEYTSGVVTIDGRVHAVVTMRRDLRDGNTYRAYVEPRSGHDAFLADVARRLNGHGSLNFQFRVADGVPKIFEINARFSGTTPLRAYAGFNEVDALLRHLLRGEPIVRPELREVVILRYWDELVVAPDQLARISARQGCPAPAAERPFAELGRARTRPDP